jgi:hypothetical protein
MLGEFYVELTIVIVPKCCIGKRTSILTPSAPPLFIDPINGIGASKSLRTRDFTIAHACLGWGILIFL